MATGSYIKSAIKEHLLAILIVLANIIGVLVGFTMLELKDGLYTSREHMYIYFLGEILLQMLKAIAPSLVIGSLVTSVSNLDTYISPRIGGQLFVYILVTKFESVALGIGLAILIRPGQIGIVKIKGFQDLEKVTLMDTILDLLRNMFPRSMIEMNFLTYETVLITPINSTKDRSEWEIKEDGNMSETMNMIGVISWSILLGTALSVMKKGNLPLIYFFHCLTKISTTITVWVLWISPVMIVCLLAGDVIGMQESPDIMPYVKRYMITIHCALLSQLILVYPIIYFFLVRNNPLMLYKHYWQALVTAFATSSSLASLPISIKSLIEKSEMDPRIVWFVIPVSHCMNMDGVAIFMGVASVFMAQLHDIELTTGNIIAVIILGAIASFVSASSPRDHVMSLIMVLEGVGLPHRELPLLIIVDWFINRSVTVVNIMGDAIAVGVMESYNKTWLELEFSNTELRNRENNMFDNSSIPNTSAAEDVTLREPATPRASTRRGTISEMKYAIRRKVHGSLDTDNPQGSDER